MPAKSYCKHKKEKLKGILINRINIQTQKNLYTRYANIENFIRLHFS